RGGHATYPGPLGLSRRNLGPLDYVVVDALCAKPRGDADCCTAVQSAASTSSAELTVRPGPGSTASHETTPSSRMAAKRCERFPRPNPVPSMVRPIASASSPLPSASMTTLLPTLWS